MDNRILRRDDRFSPGGNVEVRVDVTGIELPDGPAPLTWNYSDDPDALLGHVSNIRVEDGEILGDPVFNETKAAEHVQTLGNHVRMGGFYSDIKSSSDPALVMKARLRSVSIFPEAGFSPVAHL